VSAYGHEKRPFCGVFQSKKALGTEIANALRKPPHSMLYEFDHQQISEFSKKHTPAGAVVEVSDEELMERIQAREERALEILIERYDPMLRSVVGRMISNDQDVTDVVEEVFLGIWNQATNFKTTKGRAIGWIITMARRRAIDRVRRRQAYDRAEMRFRLSTDTGTQHLASDDVEEHAVGSDNAAIFAEFISNLPAAQQDVVRMAFYQGLSQREIARNTGIPLGTVKTRLELAVKKLRTAVTSLGSRDEWLVAAL
jgi:RNA polymerase sigma-70 factor (ECF subfamily)